MKSKHTSSPRGYAPLVVLPTSTTAEILTEVRAAGYVPVVCDDPTKVVVVLPETRMCADDILMAALHGMAGTQSSSERSRMVEELHRRLLKNEGAPGRK